MALKLKACYETEVFINQPGYLTIRQQDALDTEPALVMLSPEQAKAVIAEMEDLLKSSSDWWTAAEKSPG